jgi:hypothetical protein
MKLREGRRWVQLDHDENKKRSFVNTTMKFWVLKSKVFPGQLSDHKLLQEDPAPCSNIVCHWENQWLSSNSLTVSLAKDPLPFKFKYCGWGRRVTFPLRVLPDEGWSQMSSHWRTERTAGDAYSNWDSGPQPAARMEQKQTPYVSVLAPSEPEEASARCLKEDSIW